ncbi:MAG: hypothetical protein LBE13_07340 [Bacteroidales bacterium]|jgi:hypothetical protein|nr:hypothetical protein [Bacteroidales bacterium]
MEKLTLEFNYKEFLFCGKVLYFGVRSIETKDNTIYSSIIKEQYAINIAELFNKIHADTAAALLNKKYRNETLVPILSKLIEVKINECTENTLDKGDFCGGFQYCCDDFAKFLLENYVINNLT